MNMTNVSLIFDKKKSTLNYDWMHFCEHPEMKKYLVHEETEHGYQLRDTRTDRVVMQASMPLDSHLK